MLLQSKGRGSSQQQCANETDATAELDSHGLLQLQEEVMRDQDEALEHLSQSVQRTRVRAFLFFTRVIFFPRGVVGLRRGRGGRSRSP